MLLHDSRRPARTTPEGDIVLLEHQDRSKWDARLIAEGRALVERALGTRRFGAYTVQAAIAAVHASRRVRPPPTGDRSRPVRRPPRDRPSPVVELNRAVAVAMRDGPSAGLALIDAILDRSDLVAYHLAHAARADLLRRLGRREESRRAYERALALAKQAPERRFLRMRLAPGQTLQTAAHGPARVRHPRNPEIFRALSNRGRPVTTG